MRELYDFLHSAGVCLLATAEGGQPRLRPIGSFCLFRDRLYFQTVRVKTVSRQLHANPRVELCAMQGQRWLRVEGSAVLEDATEVRAALPTLDRLYRPEGAEAELWYLRNCNAALYEGTELVKTWRF